MYQVTVFFARAVRGRDMALVLFCFLRNEAEEEKKMVRSGLGG